MKLNLNLINKKIKILDWSKVGVFVLSVVNNTTLSSKKESKRNLSSILSISNSIKIALKYSGEKV